MPSIYDSETGEPNFELTNLEQMALKSLMEFIINENHDVILENYLTSYIISDLGPAILKGAIKSLVKLDLISEESDESGRSKRWECTSNGAEYAYTLLSRNEAPASDRFVPLDHNSQEAAAAKNALEKLEERIRTSNELTASQSERLAMISEVKGIRQLLDQSAIRVASIWAATKNTGILAWLATHVADAAITALATEAIGHLFRICGLS